MRTMIGSLSTNGLKFLFFYCLTAFWDFDPNKQKNIWLTVIKFRSFEMKDCLCPFVASNKYLLLIWKKILANKLWVI